MRTGDTLVLFAGNIAPDFKIQFKSDEKNLPTDTIFNFSEWRKEETYRKIVREDEDHNLSGSKGYYTMKEEFNIVILQNDDDEETREEFMQQIPHISTSFEIFNILPW